MMGGGMSRVSATVSGGMDLAPSKTERPAWDRSAALQLETRVATAALRVPTACKAGRGVQWVGMKMSTLPTLSPQRHGGLTLHP